MGDLAQPTYARQLVAAQSLVAPIIAAMEAIGMSDAAGRLAVGANPEQEEYTL